MEKRQRGRTKVMAQVVNMHLKIKLFIKVNHCSSLMHMHCFARYWHIPICLSDNIQTEGMARWASHQNFPLMQREPATWQRWGGLWWLLPSNTLHLSDSQGLERPDLLYFIYSCHIYLLLGRKRGVNYNYIECPPRK